MPRRFKLRGEGNDLLDRHARARGEGNGRRHGEQGEHGLSPDADPDGEQSDQRRRDGGPQLLPDEPSYGARHAVAVYGQADSGARFADDLRWVGTDVFQCDTRAAF